MKKSCFLMAALLASLTCVATMIIKIPSPLKGYVNLGDCAVLLSGWVLSPVYGFLTAGIGSALADIFSGYVIYAPATFVIKGCMALTTFYLYKFLQKKSGTLFARIISAGVSEIVMVAGYFVFEGLLYGFGASAVNILPNVIQGIFGLILGILLVKVFEKSNYL